MSILREYRFNEARSNQALEGIYSTVILRDILQRNENANQITLEKVMLYLCSSIGSVTSPNNIGKVLVNEGELEGKKTKAMSGQTIAKYIHMLCDTFIFSSVQRYDVKGKQLLKT